MFSGINWAMEMPHDAARMDAQMDARKGRRAALLMSLESSFGGAQGAAQGKPAAGEKAGQGEHGAPRGGGEIVPQVDDGAGGVGLQGDGERAGDEVEWRQGGVEPTGEPGRGVVPRFVGGGGRLVELAAGFVVHLEVVGANAADCVQVGDQA